MCLIIIIKRLQNDGFHLEIYNEQIIKIYVPISQKRLYTTFLPYDEKIFIIKII